MRPHLATLIDDFRLHACETAVVSHTGVRSYRTTYGALADLAGRFSAELNRRNIHPGDRVLLCGENSANWIAAFFGCVLRGVLAVPIDAASSPDFAARVIADVSPKLIVADPGKLPDDSEIPRLDLPDLPQLLPTDPDFTVSPAVQPDAPFQIVFTSGTTTEPKGVVHTHRNVLASLQPIETEIAKYRRYEKPFHPLRFLHTLPLSHVFGQFMGLWIPAILSAELHFTDALESGRLVYLIRRNRISVLIAVPRVLTLLRSHLLASHPSLADELPRAAGLPALKRWWHFRAIHRSFGFKFWALISGGATLPTELETFWNRVGFALIQGYGMTETAALITLNHPFRIGQGTIGKPLPGRELRLSDSGEMLVRGDTVATGSWQHGHLQQRESDWLATGDLAEQTPTGELRFVGRKGDVIVLSSGLNIYPADLESAISRQSGVQACAVVPCDTPLGSEPVCVVLFQGDDYALQQAVANANHNLADFQQIRRVLRWPEISFPYTSTGKLLRRTIADWACRAIHGQTTAPTPSSDFPLATIASITGEAPPANASDNLRLSEDLHLDSLGRVQLASTIEQRTGIVIDDTQMAALNTLGDLRRAIGTTAPTAAPAPPPTGTELSPAHVTAAEITAPPGQPAPRDVRSGSNREPRYPRWPWSAPIRLLRTLFLEAIARPLIRIFLKPRVTAPPLPPAGPFLIIANHVTALDGALVLYALPAPLRRRIAVMMSGEMLQDFRSGRDYGLAGRAAYWLLTALYNVFPLPRLQGFRQSFQHAGEAMDRGYSVLVFPEGARSQTAEMAPFRHGIGLLAAQAGAPILPVALIGLDRIRQPRAKWFRSGALEIHIGTPIPWTRSRSPADWTTTLEQTLRNLHQPATRAELSPPKPSS